MAFEFSFELRAVLRTPANVQKLLATEAALRQSDAYRESVRELGLKQAMVGAEPALGHLKQKGVIAGYERRGQTVRVQVEAHRAEAVEKVLLRIREFELVARPEDFGL